MSHMRKVMKSIKVYKVPADITLRGFSVKVENLRFIHPCLRATEPVRRKWKPFPCRMQTHAEFHDCVPAAGHLSEFVDGAHDSHAEGPRERRNIGWTDFRDGYIRKSHRQLCRGLYLIAWFGTATILAWTALGIALLSLINLVLLVCFSGNRTSDTTERDDVTEKPAAVETGREVTPTVDWRIAVVTVFLCSLSPDHWKERRFEFWHLLPASRCF